MNDVSDAATERPGDEGADGWFAASARRELVVRAGTVDGECYGLMFVAGVCRREIPDDAWLAAERRRLADIWNRLGYGMTIEEMP